MTPRGAAWCLVLLACGRSEAPPTPEGNPIADSIRASLTSEEDLEDRLNFSPGIPDHPPAQSGRVTALTVTHKDEYQLRGGWEATGLRCEGPASIQLTARGPGVGALFLVSLLDTVPPMGTLDVTREDTGPLQSSTARVGLQLFGNNRAFTFLGARGTVEIDDRGEEVSGRVGAVLLETVFRDSIGFAASFRDVPIRMGTEDECTLMGVPADSVERAP